MKGLVNEDWEHEFQKNFVYLQEEAQEFYNSLNDPGAKEVDEFLNQPEAKIEVIDLRKHKPVTIVVTGDERILANNESEVNPLPF